MCKNLDDINLEVVAMEDIEFEKIYFEGKTKEAALEIIKNKSEMCPYYEKVKCHFPKLAYSFCLDCPKLAPIITTKNIIDKTL